LILLVLAVFILTFVKDLTPTGNERYSEVKSKKKLQKYLTDERKVSKFVKRNRKSPKSSLKV